MPFSTLTRGVWGKSRSHIFGVLQFLKAVLYRYVFPIELTRSFVAELKRHRNCIGDFIQKQHGEEGKLHAPSYFDRLMCVVSIYSRGYLKVCLTWILTQFVLGVFEGTVLRDHFSVMTICDYHPAIIITAIIMDIGFVLFLIIVALSNVALYGPTCAGFIAAYSLKDSTGSMYRLARNSYPRSGQSDKLQMERWILARIYVKLLARAEARERLINIVLTIIAIFLCLSTISYLFTTNRIKMPLIQYNYVPVGVHEGIWKHLYFIIVSFSTIGYGDITFVNSNVGHILGALMSVLVIATILGFVSYISYYIINLREKIFAALDLETRPGPDWLSKSLRDI